VRESVWRRGLDWFERSNALAAREARMALRSPRAWLLLSLYVSVLGAIVLAQFPAGTSVEMWNGAGSAGEYASDSSGVSSSQRGQELLQSFALAQFLGVWLLVPSLAVGALQQEREGQTLESLLLSPLSPQQIVWGKLCGVLAMTFVLLLGTLPLTSLCFLLGGVAPEDVALRFFALLAWAMFCAGVGLFCAARTRSATKATLQAYGLSLVGLCVSFVMLGPGVVLASIGVLVWVARQAADVLRGLLARLMRAQTPNAHATANGLALMILVLSLWPTFIVLRGLNLSAILITALLVFPYGVYVSQLAVAQAAQELAKKPEPSAPKREAWREVSQAWKQAAAPESVVYTRRADGTIGLYSNGTAVPTALNNTFPSAPGTSEAAARERIGKPTYGARAFLSDKMNPIFARDLRHGVGGRAATLARWAYGAVIATQLFLIFFLINSPGAGFDDSFLNFCLKAQLVAMMLACAWLGSRSIAPERESQTLSQLLTLPMTARAVIGGKISSVLYFSMYVLLAGAPLVLMLPMAYMMSWGAALSTLVLQASWGLLAGAWGVFCSLHCGALRRALVWSLGGVVFALFGAALGEGAIAAAFGGGPAANETVGAMLEFSRWAATVLSPLSLIERALVPVYGGFSSWAGAAGGAATSQPVPWLQMLLSSAGVAAVAAWLFASSARAFARLAHGS
jgi:ABC-type transport system involved in multi-copper enzyme maturation permease subunit